MTEEELNKKSDAELIDEMGIIKWWNSVATQANAVLQKRLINKLIEALNRNATASDKLSRLIFWLTLLIAILTTWGIIIGTLEFFKH